MGLSKFNKNVQNITALSDNPNEGNDPLSSTQLKEKFDAAGVDIKNYINNTLISEIDNTVSNINDSISGLGTGVAKIGDLLNLNTTDKSTVVNAINEVNEDSGWINITPIEQPTKWQYLRCRKKGKMVCLEGRAGYDNSNFTIGNGSGSTTTSFVSKTIGTIPEGYRPSNTIHAVFSSGGKRIVRYVFGTEGTITLDYGLNMANGNYLVNENVWTSFELTYFTS